MTMTDIYFVAVLMVLTHALCYFAGRVSSDKAHLKDTQRMSEILGGMKCPKSS